MKLEPKYYEILGATKNSTIAEIKQAFRKKAKVLHPDVNKGKNAHEHFIFLTEAFEYLQNKRTNRYYNSSKDKYTHNKKNTRKWDNYYKEQTRKRAKYLRI